MSDHPKEAKRNLKRIRICNDDYFNVLRLLPPKKIGLEVAAVSDLFDALVDTHFENYRRWTLGKLEIHSDGIVKRNANGSEETLPFPQVPLPNSVVGFPRLMLRALNSDVIAFLQRIDRLLQSDISLELIISEEKDWTAFATSVWPLLTSAIKIHFGYSSDFHHMRRHLRSPSILHDCANLRVVSFSEGHQSLQFPPDDSDGSTHGQALCRWLHTPRADGQPKVLKIDSAKEFPMDVLKTHFLNATTPVNFIICLNIYGVHPFELVNSVTGEQFKARPIHGCFVNFNFCVVRTPIDKNAKQWAEWEDEAVGDVFKDKRYWKTVAINV